MAAEIQNCGWNYKIQCPRFWQHLASTPDPKVRTCGVCLQSIYLSETDDQAAAHAQLGHCVAVDVPFVGEVGHSVHILPEDEYNKITE